MADSVVIDFTANLAKFTSGIDKATKDLSRFESNAKRMSRNVKNVLGGLVIGVGIERAISSTINEIRSLEKSLSGVKAVTGATENQMASLTAEARKLGATTKFSATEAAKGMEFLGRAGFKTNQIIKAMPGLLQLAAAGALELGEASDIASNVLSGFNLPAEEINRVGDVLAKVSSSANTNVQQLGQAMSFAAPQASAFGVSLEEAAAAVGVMGNAGIQASRAGTGLAGILASLADPAAKAATAIESLGLSVKDVSPATNSLTNIVKKFADANIDGATAIRIFGREAAPAFLALKTGADSFAEIDKEARNASGTMREMSKVMSDNLDGDVKRLNSSIAELQQKIGDAGLTSGIRSLTQEFTSWTTAIGDTITALTSIDGIDLKTTNQDKIIGRMAALRNAIKGLEVDIKRTESFGPLLPGTGKYLDEMKQKLANFRTELSFLENKRKRLVNPDFGKDTEASPAPIGSPKPIVQRVEEPKAKTSTKRSGKSQAQIEAEEYARSLQSLIDTLDPASKKTRELEESIALLNKAFFSSGDIGPDQYAFLMEQLTTNTDAAAEAQRNLSTAQERASDLIKDLDPTSGIQDQIEEVQKLRDSLTEAGTAYALALADSLGEVELELNAQIDGILSKNEDAIEKTKSAWEELGPTFSSAFEDAIVEGKSFRDVLTGIDQDLLRIVTRKLVTEPLGNSISGVLQGFNLSSFFGGVRASGGPVSAGKAYLVGEEGPELFSPDSSGSVLPADKTSRALSGKSIINNFSFVLPSDSVDNRRNAEQVARLTGRRMQLAQGLV